MNAAAAPLAEIRDDVLVSICLTDGQPDGAGLAHLKALDDALDRRFRYWELLVGVDARAFGDHDRLLREMPNLRLLKLRPGTSFYRKRMAIASEAIGDIVLLTAIDELPQIDVLAMLAEAEAADAIVMGQRQGSSMLNPALEMLGRSAGFRVSTRFMQTAAYPRTLLNKLLAHPDSQLALRFPPADSSTPVRWQGVRDGQSPPRNSSQAGRRLRLIHRLLISSAPRVLTLVTMGALVVTGTALLYAVYSIVVWLTFANVQPGWFTTSMVLSMTTAFLGCAIFGLSIGLQQLIELVSRGHADDVVDETTSLDLFGKVFDELNVELHTGSSQLAAQAPNEG